MAYKFTYITVQHSGTRFLERYFLHLGFSPIRFTQRCKVCKEPHNYLHEHVAKRNRTGEFEYNWRHYTGEMQKDRDGVEQNNPFVSTLRHPHKTAVSFLSRGYDLRKCLNMWDNFIKASMLIPITYYDIDCPIQYRKSHLLDIVRTIDCYKEEHEELTDEFVSNWKPVGVYRSEYKEDYVNNSVLPDKFDWSRFDRAVNWYNRRIEEVRDNLTS